MDGNADGVVIRVTELCSFLSLRTELRNEKTEN